MKTTNWLLIGCLALLASILIVFCVLYLPKNNNNNTNECGFVGGSSSSLVEPQRKQIAAYMNMLFPQKNTGKQQWDQQSSEALKFAYMAMDVYYTYLVDGFETAIEQKTPVFTKLSVSQFPPGKFLRLFDGNVCDCLRFTFPTCRWNSSRFRSQLLEQNCPSWPGMVISVPYSFVLTRAFRTNNTSGNYITDEFTIKGKGFPDYAWFEGLAFPGEYGHPGICGATLPEALQGDQPGITDTTTGDTIKAPWNGSPWFEKGGCTSDTDCCYTPTFCVAKCMDVNNANLFPSEGSSPPSQTYCIAPVEPSAKTVSQPQKSRLSVENTEAIRNSVVLRGNPDDSLRADPVTCLNFPQTPCKSPPITGFHGLWLYPLRGVGMWINAGKSVVTNTKLGWLLAPEPHGPGYSLESLLPIVGTLSASTTNLTAQVTFVQNIIQNGQYYRTQGSVKGPTIEVADLQRHGYKKDVENDPAQARANALELVTWWYINGYSGLDTAEAPHGFNYDYLPHFPIGTYFSYAAALDVLTSGLMINRKIDTLQLVVEPQNALGSLRPAYFFETFTQLPSAASDWSFYTPGLVNACGNFYMIDPMDDWENYSRYGYVLNQKVKSKQLFNPASMTLSAASPSFLI